MNADEIAQHIATALVGRVEVGVRSLPAPAEGCVARALVLVRRAQDGERWRVVAVTSDSDVVLFTPSPVPTLTGIQGSPVARIGRAPPRIEALLASGALDEHELTALDAAFATIDVLGGLVPDAWSTLLYGIWDEAPRDRGSGVNILCNGDDGSSSMVWVAQLARGVEVTGPADGFDRPRPTWTCTTIAELAAALSPIASSVARALTARSLFLARPVTAAAVAEELREAVRRARAARGTLRVDSRGTFPEQRPSATLWRLDDLGQHHVLEVKETAAGVIVEVDGRTLAPDAVDAIVAAVAAERERLTADKLVPGATYRVTRAFGSLAVGATVTFLRTDYVPREGFNIYRFEGFQLDEWTDAHLEVLRRLHEFLQPIR